MGQFAELAERFVGDERVEAAGAAGPSDVFVAQRPSILRTVMLFWPRSERIVVVAGRRLTVMRMDLGLSRCTSIDADYDLGVGFEVDRKGARRRCDLFVGDRRILVFRGSEADRIVARLSAVDGEPT